jgi:hypothetical protein
MRHVCFRSSLHGTGARNRTPASSFGGCRPATERHRCTKYSLVNVRQISLTHLVYHGVLLVSISLTKHVRPGVPVRLVTCSSTTRASLTLGWSQARRMPRKTASMVRLIGPSMSLFAVGKVNVRSTA